MSEFLSFAELGFRHISDIQGADHILFLLALAAIYRFRDWREVAWVVTAFTIGHSVTLALAVSGMLRLPGALIEFLIPVTIILTCLENLRRRAADGESAARRVEWHRPFFAGFFGLIHGAGFANYLRSLFVENLAVPLFGFNVGLEVGQLAVLGIIAAVLAGLDWLLARVPPRRSGWTPFRVRVTAVSLGVAAVAARWALERAPW